MLKLEDVLQMKDGEEIQEIIRRHWLTLVPRLGLSFLLIVIPFFFLFPLFAWGVIGVAIFAVALLAGIVIAIRTFMLWDANVLIVTTLRLVDVDQRGIFTRIVSEASLASIQDISWMRRGMIETLFRMGTLHIETSGTHGAIELDGVGNPERINERINDLRHRTQPKRVDISPERHAQLKRIAAVLDTFSEEELTRIESILKARERSAATDAFLAEDESPKT